jgi:hypothetical protein
MVYVKVATSINIEEEVGMVDSSAVNCIDNFLITRLEFSSS